MNAPFLKAPEKTKITMTNSSIAKPCSVHCNNGEMVKSNIFCEKCPTGSFSYEENNIITSDSCQRCSPGRYASEKGSTNCSQCAEGTYAQKYGNTGCKKCTNDFLTSDSGSSSCSKMTIEFILILSGSIPMILIPLFLLLGRRFQKRRHLKMKARLEHEKYNRFGHINS
ncbi:uncharacterized protein LOC114532376 isoform X2 [Dendronephthya gigantea]|nr:uncharacterized protein LOC114532376 isoform X2 [Dendronephthya gigantea]